jgi:hypothetical protein
MLSSLSIPAASRPASRIAPTGAGSFLTIQQISPPALGGGDLATLLNLRDRCEACSFGHICGGNLAACPATQKAKCRSCSYGHACMGDLAQCPCNRSADHASRQVSHIGNSDFAISHFDSGSFTDKTIAAMHRGVLQAKTSGPFRAEMERIRQLGRDQGAVGWKDYMGEVIWFDHYYRNLYPLDYVRDPHQVELVMHPAETYKKRLGDCDDLSTLWAASLGALGAPHVFTTYRADPRRPDEFSHVASKVYVPKVGWVNNDLTIKGAAPGFEPMGFPSKNWPEPKWS